MSPVRICDLRTRQSDREQVFQVRSGGERRSLLRVEHPGPSEVDDASTEDEPEVLVEARRRMSGAFADASFSPCGLDARWKGTRWFGSNGSSNGLVTSLELAHGEDPWDEATPQVRVGVRLPRSRSKGDDTNVEIEAPSSARKKSAVSGWRPGRSIRKSAPAAFSDGAVLGETMAPWADAEIPIDETTVAFRRLGDDRYWLAQASHGRLLVAIESRAWPVE